ncbi:MAG: patatin-like phospholipase family protein [Betaproteobacteria bacterium]|nr:patatin-like phospholipase family protein [Betaproteobacteria bacterium]
MYAHTGFLLALEQLGVSICASAGCSAGAVVGGVAASGTSLDRWAQAIVRVSQREFWTPDSLARFLWQMAVHRGRGYTGLSSTDAAISYCRRNLAAQTFGECRYPFYAVAMSLGRGHKVVFSAGELAPRMMASAAMPILYRPVKIDGDYYCDGALVDLAPMDAICCRHRLDALIIHHVSQRYDQPGGFKKVLRRRWAIAEISTRLLFHQRPWYLSDERLTLRRCPDGCGAVIVVLEPDLPELRWPLTEGGPKVLQAALAQTLALLQPHADALLTDPRARLPALEVDPAGNAARRAAVCAPGPQ